MVPTPRTAFVVASALVVGSLFVGEPPSPTAAAAVSSASELVGDADAVARRLVNQRVVADPPPPPPVVDVATEVIRLVNVERAGLGLAPVAAHARLVTAADGHSRDQATMQRMTHTGSDGSSPGDRIARAGYRWRTWAENVAMGQRSPDAVMDAWMNSPGHRGNILNVAMDHIGVAAVTDADGRRYWTMVLASPRS